MVENLYVISLQLNYLNDNGILEPTSDNDGYSTQFKYSKLNIRTNLDITVSPTTTVQLNLFGNFSEHNRPGETTSNIFSALYQVPSGAFPVKRLAMYGVVQLYIPTIRLQVFPVEAMLALKPVICMLI